MAERVRQIAHPTPPPPPDTTPESNISVRSVALTMIAIGVTMYVLHWAREVFIPIVLSILISYALEPVVAWMTRIRLPRAAAAAVVVTLITGLVGYGVYSLSDDGGAIVAKLPAAARQLRQIMARDRNESGGMQRVRKPAEQRYRPAGPAAVENPVAKDVTRVQIEEPAINVREYVSWGQAGVIAFGGQATLVFFFVFFLLASGDLFKRKFVKIAGPSLEKKRVTVQIL